jgi:hypothetical protein
MNTPPKMKVPMMSWQPRMMLWKPLMRWPRAYCWSS